MANVHLNDEVYKKIYLKQMDIFKEYGIKVTAKELIERCINKSIEKIDEDIIEEKQFGIEKE